MNEIEKAFAQFRHVDTQLIHSRSSNRAGAFKPTPPMTRYVFEREGSQNLYAVDFWASGNLCQAARLGKQRHVPLYQGPLYLSLIAAAKSLHARGPW